MKGRTSKRTGQTLKNAGRSSKRTGQRTAHLLKYIRAVLGSIVLLVLTAFFLDFTGRLPLKLHALAHVQLIPAILAGAWIVVAVILVFTLLFGRLYCSVLCPLGVLQDVIGRCRRLFLSRKRRKPDPKTAYRKPHNWLRYTVLAIAVIPPVALASTFPLLVLDPYSNFGRIATGLFKPVVIWGNNALASMLNAHGNFSLYIVRQHPSLWVVIFAATVLVALIVMVSLRGRLWCNTLCPVGTLLGLVSRRSLVRITIDQTACNHCNRCTARCKADCIDQRNNKVDGDRCVMCYNCLSVCPQGGISYKAVGWGRRKVSSPEGTGGVRGAEKAVKAKEEKADHDESRRKFLTTTALALTIAPVATALAQADTVALGKGMGHLLDEPTRERLLNATRRYPLPPGAVPKFSYKCTACQLCISKCPMRVLRPAGLERGLTRVMQPQMYFEPEVYCNYECTVCSHVCPTGALLPLTVEQKRVRQIGVVHFVRGECIVETERQDCGACAEHCPTGAVHMVPFDKDQSLTIPATDTTVCIGCGACESICPVRPMAIYVEGLESQREAQPPKSDDHGPTKVEGFGF